MKINDIFAMVEKAAEKNATDTSDHEELNQPRAVLNQTGALLGDIRSTWLVLEFMHGILKKM
jgi:hypothetical protein